MSIIVDVNRVSNMVPQDASLKGMPSWSTQHENIYEKLKNAAQDGDIERLYELLGEDPNILCHFDKVRFCETPLHIAAEKGQNHFAMELMILKPSLASKLNASGFSPMHLAMKNNHIRMVRGFVAINSSLVRIKGRGGTTPLHHVAQTAVHIAVKNQQLMAFKVLLGWIKRVNKEEILEMKDEDGNTVLHIAASINQTVVMKLLRRTVKLKTKNLEGKTFMDILQPPQSHCFPEARRSLHNFKERLLCRSPMTLAGYLTKNLSFIERRNNLLGLSNLSLTSEMSVHTSNRRDATLVVAILIVTATYQAGLSPPGGFWQDNENHPAGQMIMSFSDAFLFIGLNDFAFISAIYVIMVLIIGLPMWKLVYASVAGLGIALLASYITIFPIVEQGIFANISRAIFILAFPLIIGIMLFATFMAFIGDKRRRHRVDFPASCFNVSDPAHPGYLILFSGICVSVVFLYIHFYQG
ncbi:PGG domain-containing protein [Hirschfeldia incana]|nr:PGG domain-containing protein [Hirschfeldia incana]